MTTAVASPPTFQPIPRLGRNDAPPKGGSFNSMSEYGVSRMFMPQKKNIQRTNSSSSIASTSSSTSTATTTTQTDSSSPSLPNGEISSNVGKKKPRGGFWPAKSEPTSALSNGKANGVNGVGSTQALPALPSQNGSQLQANGARPFTGSGHDQSAVLALLPMNGTFERKQISVPFFPDVLRVGRQTNAKTVPTPSNGFFDSKVLSRQHAELWAERNGKVWIRDVKSSNGTFVNGQRLSAENRDSEPHELRQHDTLELGIDIVSEDQKTIVHHKVSAKVEYVGLPGTSNNVMDLNFGDLDPSHGGPLLPSAMSTPMAHSRSRPGGIVTNGRPSSAASAAGSQTANLAQQRQLNFWGTPLNVEQLVKSLSLEMKAARQQSLDLETANVMLDYVMSPEASHSRPQADQKDTSQSSKSSIRARSLRLDSATRFAEPPAPPPQQPLPEKPDAAQSSLAGSSNFSFLKRSDTAKAPLNTTTSPHSPQNSQILSLVEALSIAKKELDSQGARVKQLEDMLRQERSARENAEDRARRLEHYQTSGPVLEAETVDQAFSSAPIPRKPIEATRGADDTTLVGGPVPKDVQQHLDSMVSEMQRMQSEIHKYQTRAETAESDATRARMSLSEMIARLREQNLEATNEEEIVDGKVVPSQLDHLQDDDTSVGSSGLVGQSKLSFNQINGHVRTSSQLREPLERALATVLRDGQGAGDGLAQSAPYVSMLGVMLIGVGLMAYLNSWQKTER